MTRALHKLSARAVATLSTPGRHSDGGGLYLSISKTGGRKWVFMWTRAGKQREAGLGSARLVTLAEARAAAAECRAMLHRHEKTLSPRKKPPRRSPSAAGASLKSLRS